MKNSSSFTAFLQTRQALSKELAEILVRMSCVAKQIDQAIRLASFSNHLGSTSSLNVQGEVQQKLDLIAHNILVKNFETVSALAAILSEEAKDAVECNYKTGEYLLAVDPLDGSSNIDVNAPIGTIFSIYSRTKTGKVTHKEFLQPGSAQLASGYMLYGPSTVFVLTIGNGVHSFTYDDGKNEFFLSDYSLTTPKKGKIYSMNEGLYHTCSPALQKYVDMCKKHQYTARYIGSLVADFHRNLLKGGIYIYPATKAHPQGKLRLMYECNPLALLVEQAGGRATNGHGESILALIPQHIHARTPLYIGSEEMVAEADK